MCLNNLLVGLLLNVPNGRSHVGVPGDEYGNVVIVVEG